MSSQVTTHSKQVKNSKQTHIMLLTWHWHINKHTGEYNRQGFETKGKEGPHISLKAANGDMMAVEGLTTLYLDLYEGKYERNEYSTRTPFNVLSRSAFF